jgi:hypothetical protein
MHNGCPSIEKNGPDDRTTVNLSRAVDQILQTPSHRFRLMVCATV